MTYPCVDVQVADDADYVVLNHPHKRDGDFVDFPRRRSKKG